MNTSPSPSRPVVTARPSLRRTAALAVAAALLGTGVLGAAPTAHAETEGRARGYDLRCSARLDGQPVQVVVHDPDRGLPYSYLRIGRGDDQVTDHTDAGGVVSQRKVGLRLELDGDPAVLTGSVRRDGDPHRVARTSRDGLGTYVTRGTRTPVRTHLEVRWRGESAPVSCRWASAFDLTTTRQ